MEFSILGPLEVRAGDRAVVLGGTKPRGLLAQLLLHANEPVSAERLAVGLWGEDASADAVKTVQVYIARLRRALGDREAVITAGAGYRLRVRPGELDADRFGQLLAAGRDALAVGDTKAGEVLREALALWRGPPLVELAGMPFAPAEIARLEEQRLEALELRVQADLAAGRHTELVAELGRLTREHPLRERLHGQLMLALYRSGRQADALEAYRMARAVLVDELGVEPGEELAELHRAVLAHDPALGPPRRERATPTGRRGGRIPRAPNRTIGRERQLWTITGRVRQDGVRLLTLIGPGGVGKTRLAIEAASASEADFSHGACFVSLASVRRVEDVPMTTVQALDAVVLDGESAQQALVRFLAGRRLLLVVDNCEHLPGVSVFVGELLEACPGVTVLATSREPLDLRAEVRHPVPPLSLPDGTGSGNAVTLFAERARAHDPDFAADARSGAAMTEICRRLDGLPLAIELAAARCSLLTPLEIAQRLDTALGALGAGARDVPERQRTLRATIDWSYDLLDEEERACFARFAVFAGGATVDAAETITGADLDTVDRLVAKSLLTRRPQPDGRTRIAMLETIREYAGERFAAAPEAEAVHERHFRHFLSLAERSGSERALWGAGRKEHLGRLDADVENLHAALGWAVAGAKVESALAMCAALPRYWRMRNRNADADRWIDDALGLPGAERRVALRIRVLVAKEWAVFRLGRGREQAELMDEAERLARSTDDPALLSEVLRIRSAHALNQGDLELADRLADEALDWARRTGDDWRLAMAAHTKAMASRAPADLRERVDRAVALLERVGNVYFVADLLASAAYGALCLGSDVDAAEFVARATPVTRRLDHPYLWMLLRGNAGLAALFTGDTEAARAAFREELELSRELAVLPFAGEGLGGLGAVAVVRGEAERAAWLYGAAQTHRYGQPRDAVDERLRAAFFDPARERWGVETWDAAVRRGAAMAFEDAIAAALAERPPERGGVAAA
jgi:predicted ATPase/DNA-binding SARP family transcriptional activator